MGTARIGPEKSVFVPLSEKTNTHLSKAETESKFIDRFFLTNPKRTAQYVKLECLPQLALWVKKQKKPQFS